MPLRIIIALSRTGIGTVRWVAKAAICGLIGILVFTCQIRPASAAIGPQSGGPAQSANVQAAGHQHDFDWEIGDWKVHLRRLLHPLAGVEYVGGV
jgi:hypothetical protein